MDRYESYDRRRKLRIRAIEVLGGKCAQCGYNGSPAAFDFHHIDPVEKDFDIASKMSSWKAIEEELKKCVLLCANCHRETHDGYHPQWLDLEKDRGWSGED